MCTLHFEKNHLVYGANVISTVLKKPKWVVLILPVHAFLTCSTQDNSLTRFCSETHKRLNKKINTTKRLYFQLHQTVSNSVDTMSLSSDTYVPHKKPRPYWNCLESLYCVLVAHVKTRDTSKFYLIFPPNKWLLDRCQSASPQVPNVTRPDKRLTKCQFGHPELLLPTESATKDL